MIIYLYRARNWTVWSTAFTAIKKLRSSIRKWGTTSASVALFATRGVGKGFIGEGGADAAGEDLPRNQCTLHFPLLQGYVAAQASSPHPKFIPDLSNSHRNDCPAEGDFRASHGASNSRKCNSIFRLPVSVR